MTLNDYCDTIQEQAKLYVYYVRQVKNCQALAKLVNKDESDTIVHLNKTLIYMQEMAKRYQPAYRLSTEEKDASL